MGNPLSNRSDNEMYLHDTVKTSSQPLSPVQAMNPLNVNESELTSADLESIAILYDKIRQLFRNKGAFLTMNNDERENKDMELAKDFDNNLTEVMSSLNQNLT